MKKIIITLFALLLIQDAALAARETPVGIIGVDSDSPRAATLSRFVETHLDNIMYSNIVNSGNVFQRVNPEVLRDQLSRFNCLEDSCVLRFARRAGISIIIRGSLEERNEVITLTLYAMGVEAPYFGRDIHRYRVSIPTVNLQLGTREYSYIFEEHAARFLEGFLRNYQKPVPIKMVNGRPVPDTDEALSGTFRVFRFVPEGSKLSSIRRFFPLGMAVISEGGMEIQSAVLGGLRDGDFILLNYRGRSRTLEEFYHGRKREIVFTESSYHDTVYMMLFTVPGSLTMPLVAPVMGYFNNRDYMGLALWTVNVSPYLYLQYDGIRNRPQTLRSERRDIPREVTARYNFALYMLFMGNMSLFVDAFSYNYLNLASNYQGMQQLMGSGLTAAYLSLISGGGGHFYRGYRGWGYLYFHLNNALIYYTMREFSPDMHYDEASGSYQKDDINSRRAYMFLGALGVLKTVEILHAVLLKDRIHNGIIEEGDINLIPVVMYDPRGDVILGAAVSGRF